MSSRFLVEKFTAWRDRGESLVLATVLETEGSTYSKTGRQLLINRNHDYAGLVGGGCLEGDLILRADEVFAHGKATVVMYDMRDDADDLWGMGLGCRGMMKLLLQRLDKNNNWAPFSQLSELMAGTAPVPVALAIEDHDGVTTGQLVDPQTGGPAVRWSIKPWPRLLICGAGPDAGPVVDIAKTLGWHVSVADHRPELLDATQLDGADARHTVQPEAAATTLELADYSAVCVMSHHLQSDLHYLKALRRYAHPYVGVLGPAQRKAELLAQLDDPQGEFAARLRGPVGLQIGADSPQTIALAMLAEIQSVMSDTS